MRVACFLRQKPVQLSGRGVAHLMMSGQDARKGWSALTADEVVVVDAQNGDGLGYAEVRHCTGGEEAFGDGIAGGEYGSRLWERAEPFGDVRAFGWNAWRNVGLLQGLNESGQPFV